jgi:hypothetical protein
VQLVADGASFEARILDASRGGVRLKVGGAALGVYRLAPLNYVSRQVARLLGVEFEVRFDPQRLGPLLCKRLRPVRIGQRDATSADVELGCVFSEAFRDEEAVVLGLNLPAVGEDGVEPGGPASEPTPAPKASSAPAPAGRVSVPPPIAPPTPPPLAPRRPAPAPAAAAGTAPALPPPPAPASAPPPPPVPLHAARPAPARPAPPPRSTEAPDGRGSRDAHGWSGWHAFVHPMGGRDAPPFIAQAHGITSAGVQLRVAERAQLMLSGPPDVASTMSALGAAYGADVALRVVDGATPLWTGPARIEMIEVGASAPHAVTLWLAYGRALRPAELRALELV